MIRFKLHMCSIGLAMLLTANRTLAQTSDATGKARLHVVRDFDRQALSRVRITLSGGRLTEPILTTTDATGSWSVSNLDRGRYSLSIEKPGYFPVSGPKALAFSIEAGQDDVDLGEIPVIAMRSIKGVVRWRDGDAADHVVVHALLVRRGKATFRPGDARLAPTNEHGEYRLEGLQPGRYVVFAYTVGLAAAEANPRVATPVFYPNTFSPDIGSSIDLRNAVEANDISMTLAESNGVKVSGTVESASGVPNGTVIMVGLMIGGVPSQPFVGTRATIGKLFEINNVPPGNYQMIVAVERQNKRAFHNVIVNSVPVENLSLSFASDQSLEGTVEIRQIKTKSAKDRDDTYEIVPAPHVRILGQCEDLALFGVVPGESDEHGAFRMSGTAAGEAYKLTFQLPPNGYVYEILQGGKQLIAPSTAVAGAGNVLIRLKTDGGTIEGRIKTTATTSAPGFIVVEPEKMSAESVYRTARTNADGTYLLEGIAPGSYRLYGFPENEEDSYLEDGYLGRYRDQAIMVSVAPGTHSRVALPLITRSQ